jgi:hypothetical protein
MLRAYAWLALALSPVMAALWRWPAGAVAMALALILAALHSRKKRKESHD